MEITKKLKHIKNVFLDLITLLIVGLTIGIVLGIVSNLFVDGVSKINNFRLSLNQERYVLLTNEFETITPILFLISSALLILVVRKLFKIDRFHGPPDSILASHQSKNSIDIRKGMGSTLTAFISASGGASVGQYGPLVHFGATLASYFEKFTKRNLPPGIFIGCGVAAAISAGFNAPIAGLVFAHEAILRHFSLRAGGAIAVSSIVASTIGSSFFEFNQNLVVSDKAPNLFEITPVVLLFSPLLAFAAILFMYGIRLGPKIAKKTKLSPIYLLLIASLICGSIGIFYPQILGLGGNEMNQILSGEFTIFFLLILFLGKIFTTSICIGFGFFGGIFAPALFVGSAAGALIAKIIILFGFSVSLPAMALVGTAAIGAVAIGAPIATTLIILEFTGSYEFAVAALVAVQVSSFITHRLYGDSLFDMALNDRGIKISLGRQHIQMSDLKISDIATNEAIVFQSNITNDKILSKMKNEKVTEAIVKNIDDEYVGKIMFHDIIDNKLNLTAEYLADRKSLVFESHQSLVECIEMASNFVGEFIPVRDKNSKKYIGSVAEADLFQAYLKLQNQVRFEEKDI